MRLQQHAAWNSGLLSCMAGLRQRTLLDGNDLFLEFKGALTEQYVCQQLKTIEDLGGCITIPTTEAPVKSTSLWILANKSSLQK